MRHRSSGLAWSSASVGTGFVEYADEQKDRQSANVYEHGFIKTHAHPGLALMLTWSQ